MTHPERVNDSHLSNTTETGDIILLSPEKLMFYCLTIIINIILLNEKSNASPIGQQVPWF